MKRIKCIKTSTKPSWLITLDEHKYSIDSSAFKKMLLWVYLFYDDTRKDLIEKNPSSVIFNHNMAFPTEPKEFSVFEKKNLILKWKNFILESPAHCSVENACLEWEFKCSLALENTLVPLKLHTYYPSDIIAVLNMIISDMNKSFPQIDTYDFKPKLNRTRNKNKYVYDIAVIKNDSIEIAILPDSRFE